MEIHTLQNNPDGTTSLNTIEGMNAIALDKGPVVISSPGGLNTKDNVPCNLEDFMQDARRKYPRVLEFVDRVSPYWDSETVYQILVTGRDTAIKGHLGTLSRLFGPSPSIPNPPKIHGLTYNYLEDCMVRYDHVHGAPNVYFSDEAMDLVRRVFPIYLGKGVEIVKKGDSWQVIASKPASVEDVLQVTHNLIFFGNSFGTVFITEIENALLFTLRGIGFDEKEITAIMASIRAMGTGNVSPFVALTGPRFTAIFFEGLNDVVSRLLNPHRVIITPEEIRAFIPQEQQEQLVKALSVFEAEAEKYTTCPGSRRPPNRDPNALENIPCAIFRKPGPNRLLVLTTVQTYKARWIMGYNTNWDSVAADLAHWFELVSDDRAGHNLGWWLEQGLPASVVPVMTRRAASNAYAFTQMPRARQDAFKVENLLDPLPDIKARQQLPNMFQEVVGEGLDRAVDPYIKFQLGHLLNNNA